MNTFDFEEEVVGLEEDLAKLKEMANKGEVDLQKNIDELEAKIKAKKREIYDQLNGWQRVQVSRHPERPYTLYYIEQIFDEFIELHGDRNVQDDKAIVGGLAKLNGQSVMVIGHQKGINTKMRQYRNFGMANPEGYRKALRLMKLAEKFNIPIISLVDTPGAFPGLEAEERGQGEAIARNIYEMFNLTVPIVVTVIGEGASGGAIGIGVGDRVMMLENTWYSVISPESCSSILWRSWDFKEQAAEQLKLSAKHMKDFGLIDRIITEPDGGAHSDPEKMAEILKNVLEEEISQLSKIAVSELKANRIEKFSKMGEFDLVN